MNSAELLDFFRRDRARGANADIDLTLRPAYRELLSKLGNPHERLPPVFHVAGTNGKGSTCAFLRAMLEAAGYRVHVYTSPHLVRFHERIRLAGKLIEESELVALLTECRKLSEPGTVTYFEAATAIAFTAFTRHDADFTILEVGLGGRLDATNIIPKPRADIIARLSFDHRDYLGDTMQAIAHEKAGIMRAGVPCFAAAQPDAHAFETLQSEAKKIGAPLSVADRDWKIGINDAGFQYTDARHSLSLPKPALQGEHQFANAGLAIAALLGTHTKISETDMAKGLRSVEWPARLQHIQTGRLARLLPQTSELWLDGGHNDSAGAALSKQAEIWAKDGRPLHLVCGMLTTKKPAEFLAPLAPFAASFTAVPIPDDPTSFMADDLAKEAARVGIQNTQPANNAEEALRKILSVSQTPSRILICGSLYLAGEVLKVNAG